MLAPDPDLPLRLAAFARLKSLVQQHGDALPWSLLKEGFHYEGEAVRFASAAEGIFKPARMRGVLSIKSVVPRPGRRAWYADQRGPDEQLRARSDVFAYAFKGQDPEDPRNRLLLDAMQRELPLIYFYGVAPSVYEPVYPVYVVDWSSATLTASVAVSTLDAVEDRYAEPEPASRRYAIREVRQRLHQAMFRERVLAAYEERCALSGLPERHLVDAAHIVADADQELGQPDVRNGICLSKVHHAAFDAHLIGIDPDYRVHVSAQLLRLHDGPLLEQALKRLDGTTLRLPRHQEAWPDRERLAVRFAAFRALAA